MGKFVYKVRIRRSQGYYTASIPELGIADYGKTKKELTKNMREAISLALFDMIESRNVKQRKVASKIFSEAIAERKVPQQNARTVSNILAHIFL